MKRKKRWLSLLLAAVFILGTFPETALASGDLAEPAADLTEASETVLEETSVEADADVEEAGPDEELLELPDGEDLTELSSADEEPIVEEPEQAPAAEEPEEPAAEEPEVPVTEEPEVLEELEAEDLEESSLVAALYLETEGDYLLASEAEVFSDDVVLSARDWGSEEELRYAELLNAARESDADLLAVSIRDGSDAAVSFEEEVELYLTHRAWQTQSLEALESRGFQLYLSDENGELSEAEIEIRLTENGVPALFFKTAYLGDVLLTGEKVQTVAEEDKPEDSGDSVDVSGHPLREVAASDDEPLLSTDQLSPRTLALLGMLSAQKNAFNGGGDSRAMANGDITTEGPVEGDGVTIERVSVKWLSRSTGEEEPAGQGTLHLSTDADTIGNQQFQLDFAISGRDDHEPGSVEIIFPAYLWLDRYGEEPGYLTLSVPEDPENGADFAWRREGDNIIITNVHRIKAASKVMIQGTFRNVKPYNMVDKDVAEGSDYYDARNKGVSDPFDVVIGITTLNDQYLALKSNSIYAEIDTHVDAASATKSAFNTSSREYYVYHTKEAATSKGGIPAEFLAQLEDPDEYSFARWYVSGSATGSQPFHMTVTDSYDGTVIHYLDAQHQQSETMNVEGRILGVQGALVENEEGQYVTGNVVAEGDGQSVTATIYDGYNTLPKSAYVWTAYKKDQFPTEGDEYRISNHQVTEVTGWDDMITTTKEATATAPFRLPVNYAVKKVWNDPEGGHEDRIPKHQSIIRYYNENLRTWDKIRLDESNDWTYTWDDEGTGRQYKIRELGQSSGGWEAGHEEDDAYLLDGSDYYFSYNSPNFMNIPDEEYSHIINRQYDEDGELREYDRWWWSLEKEEYDSENHTWIKYNKYNEEHVVRTRVPFREQKLEVGVQKSQVSNWDNSRMSTYDRDLNVLRRGDNVVVRYNVDGYGYIIELTKDQDIGDNPVDITSFGFRDVKLGLEDNYGEDTTKENKGNTFLFDSAIRLTPEDVEVANVTLYTPRYYQYYQPDKYSVWTFRTLTAEDFGDVDRPDEELWGLLIDGEERTWVRYAVLSTDGAGNVTITTENGATKSGTNTINLPRHVWKVKTVMTIPGLRDAADVSRRIDGARMEYDIGVRLLASSQTIQDRLNVLFDADDYAMSTLDNYAALNVFEQLNGEDDPSGWKTTVDDQSRAWLHGRNYRSAVRATKSFEVTENDLIAHLLKLHSKVEMIQQSNILERSYYMDARNEGLIPATETGTWYDLLPLGVRPILDSVRLTNGNDTITDRYIIDNYKQSGRAMLVVKAALSPNISYQNRHDPNPYSSDITYPKEGYKDTHSLEFDAYYDWDEARLYGIGSNVRNVAAFETDDPALGNIEGWRGEPDDPQKNHNQRAMNAVGDDKELMTGLDPERDPNNNAFVYAGAVLKSEELDFAARTELMKYVTRDGLGLWTTGRASSSTQVTVYEGDFYSYMLYVASDGFTTTKNIILLDSLDSYVPKEEDGVDYGHKQWEGNFVSVDVSGLEEIGIAPVVYYNTSPMDLEVLKAGGIETSDGTEIDDPEKVANYLQGNDWTTVKPADPSTVRAIAVDIRHMQDGSEFELSPSESVFCTVRMRSKVYETTGGENDPFNADEEARKSAENNGYAYNGLYMGCTQVDPVGQQTHAVIENHYTRVGILPFELNVTKQWDDAGNNDGKRPNAITVHLLANGQQMDPDRTVTLNDSNEWTGRFEHVIRYDDAGNWINYTFEEETKDENPAFNLEGYVMTAERDGENVTLINKYIPEKTSVPFTKEWEGDDGPEAQGARPSSIIVRLKADGVYTGKTVTVKPDIDGNWAGQFKDLPRFTNPEGLSGRQHEIEYTVEEEPVYKYEASYQVDEETGVTKITNRFYPYGNLSVTKTVTNVTEASQDKDFTFTLLLKDKDGEDLTETYSYWIVAADATPAEDAEPDGSIGNGATFTLKGGQKLVIRDIPSESTYQVVEAETPGFTMTGSSGSSGTIRAGATQSAGFTNHYDAVGNRSLSLYKTLEGRVMSRYQFRFELVDKTEGSDTFDQVIRTASADADGNATFSRLNYTEADHGKTFTYLIREVDREKPGYTYDTNTYTVTIDVTDNGNGTMTCTPTYYNGDGVDEANKLVEKTGEDGLPILPADQVIFENEYHATGELVLRAWKQLEGGELTDYGPFNFALYKVDNDPASETYKQATMIQTKESNEQGTIAFNALQFTEADAGKEYFYVIKEIPGENEKVIYDESVKGVKLSVADNGDGTMAVTQTNVGVAIEQIPGEGETQIDVYTALGEIMDLPVFVNGLEPGDVSVTKLTTWDDAEPDSSVDFSFSLTLVGDELPEQIKVQLSDSDSRQKEYTENPEALLLTDEQKAEQTVDLNITSAEGETPMVGEYTFTLKAGQKLTVKELPAGVAYQFQEQIPSGWTLSFENVAGVIVPQAEQKAVYTNTFEPGTTVATVLATKRLDGKTPPEKKFAFELVDDNEESETYGQALQTLWNHASGFVLFDLHFNEEGTYHYILREVQGLVESVDDDGNITYSTDEDELRKISFDENQYHVTINVTKQENEGFETLTAETVYVENDGNPPQFKNKTNPGSLQIKKVGVGLTDANKNAEFTFKVKLSNDAGMPLTQGGGMFWYAEESEEIAEPEASPAIPPLPENAEPEPEEAPAAASAENGRTLNAVRRQLLGAPAKAPLAAPLLGASGATVSHSGVFNDTYNNVKWTLYSDGTLIIEPVNGVSGTLRGTNENYEGNDAALRLWPWNNYRSSITSVQVKGRIEVIRGLRCMFENCSNLKYADLSGIYTTSSFLCTSFIFSGCKLEYLDISNMVVTSSMYNRDQYAPVDMRNQSYLKFVKFGPNYYKVAEMPNGANWKNLDTGVVKTSLNGLSDANLAGTWVRGNYSPTYTIEFNANGATGSMDPVTGSLLNPPTLPLCTFESDLNFAGWSTDPNAILPEYADGGEFTGTVIPGGSITLYAIWMSEDSFLLHYDGNGGYSRVQWQRVNGPTDSVTMPVPTHPSNYEFLYWSTEPEGGGQRYTGTVSGADFGAAPGATVNLYAQFLDPSRKARITTEHYQQKPDRSGYDAQPINRDYDIANIGDEVTPPTREYLGFRTPATQTVVAKQGGNTVQYYYDRTEYTLAFDGNGEDVTGSMDNMTMTGGVPTKLPVNRFAKENALFIGWNTAPDGSGTNYGDGQSVNTIAGDGETLTLYAQWYNLDEAQTAEPTDGEYEVKCHANETIYFPMLPAGTHYTVTEVKLPDGWTLTGLENDSGTVLSAERINVTATNTYSATGVAELSARKALPGENMATGQFSFQLLDADNNDALLQTVSNSSVDIAETVLDDEGNEIPNTYYNTAPVFFEVLTFDHQGVYHYKIKEVQGSDGSISYDEHVENVTVYVTDRGDGRLTTQVFYDESGANFRNDMSSGDLTVTKTITNATAAAADSKFTFTLYLFDRNNNEILDSFPVKLSDGTESSIASRGTVSMKGGESFTVTGLPHKCHYIVVETPAAGFEQVRDDNSEGTILAGQIAQADFENAYSSKTEDGGGGAVIEAKKVFEYGVIEEEQFQFRLMNSGGEELETVYADPDGTVKFSALHYTLEDDGQRYVYYVEEVPGDDPNVIYDTHREQVAVTVSDNGDGTMSTEVEYDRASAEAENEPPTFTNRKRLSSLKITKTLERFAGPDAATFVFEINGVVGGELVYSNVASLTFTGPGTKSVVIEGLAVGMEVTVTEVYSGSRYTGTTEPWTTTIPEPEQAPAEVSFTNDYDDTGKGGHGILNEFKSVQNPSYDADDPDSPEYIWDDWQKPNMNNG